MHPDEATRQIAEIHKRMAWSQTFRGFPPLAVAFSSLLAFLGGALQERVVPWPRENPGEFVTFWMVIAAVSLASACAGTWTWIRRTCSELAFAKARHAMAQVSPGLAVGAILTHFVAPESGWMLPGIWSLTFSLAVFSTRHLLTREVAWVGMYYAVAGTGCLAFGNGDQAYAPWQMTLSFGGGQLFGAAVLFWTVERAT